ncbi:uncharacterized protein LOC106663458 [Cimex lectularius]|uniref:Odorant binding protein n=1 Tax=Cimex lectularius TaxID=79782 RepID=A0A8I6RKG2_CIMLE|nr:uncharacterized protein LOC106663458 [Cimex lectularius]
MLKMNCAAAICLVFLFAFSKGAEVPTTTEGAGMTTSGVEKSTTASGSTVKGEEDVRQEIKAQLHALSEGCKTKTEISAEAAQISINQQIPKTEPEKCYLECIYNGMGLAKDGQFNEKGARVLAQKRFAESSEELSKANLMIEACSKEAVVKDTTEKCAIGRMIRECFVKNGAKINFFPKP